MSHGSLGVARHAMRQNSMAGEVFRETHGLHGYFAKLFHSTAIRCQLALSADPKSFRTLPCNPCESPLPHALQGFAANITPCAGVRPECVHPAPAHETKTHRNEWEIQNMYTKQYAANQGRSTTYTRRQYNMPIVNL